MSGSLEQRNPYKGFPGRPWVRLRLLATDGATQELELVADTGNPYAVIIETAQMLRFKWTDAPRADHKLRTSGRWVDPSCHSRNRP